MEMVLSPLRFVRPLVLGGAVAFGMFWALYLMITGGTGFEASESLATVDFVRLKRQTELETIQRRKPEKPPPPKQPPPPQLKVQTDVKPQQTQMMVNIPNIPMSVNLGSGPFIGTWTSAENMVGDADLIPMVRIAPQYPQKAARDGVEGEVTLEITVGPDGAVKNAKVKSAKPRGYFEAAAIAAAYKGRFRPKVLDGKPMETTGVYTVKFKLAEE